VFAPAGTPHDTVSRISRSIAAVFKEPEFKERYVESNGYSGIASTPEEFAVFIKDDLAYKRNMIERAGIKPE
jgi:tripartite-type tricarboxylate transporter receptor subunit TctC